MNRHTHCSYALIALAAVGFLFVVTPPAFGWGAGHKWIRQWAVQQQPQWVAEHFGANNVDALCQKYTSLQDAYAGSRSPALAKYCVIPDVRVSLHDVNPVEPTFTAVRWYLDRIQAELAAGNGDEAMKYLGVLCHWNEDPGSLSAHSSPVSEQLLRELIPPRDDQQNKNYLFGAGSIGNERNVGLDGLSYQPQLLGRDIAGAAVQITHHQELVRRHSAGLIVSALIGHVENDEDRLNRAIASALTCTARHIADVIYTVAWLTANGEKDADAKGPGDQRLTEWLSPTQGSMIPHPYYVRPYIINQSMDASRKLHPLALFDSNRQAQPVAFGMGMGAPYTLPFTFANGGVYDRMTVRVGLHPTAGAEGKVGFVVRLNGIEAAKVEPIAAGEPAQVIDVALPDTDVVQLQLQTFAGEGSASLANLAVWGEPLLHCSKSRNP